MSNDPSDTSLIKPFIWGIAWILAASMFWYSLTGNPFEELSLILHSQIVDGFIIDTWEDADADDRVIWYHRVIYKYQLADGREFTQTTKQSKGRLREELSNLREPYPIKVEYLQDDPGISRIKGEGSETLFDWIWRKIGLGLLLLILFNSPGILIIRNGLRDRRRMLTDPNLQIK